MDEQVFRAKFVPRILYYYVIQLAISGKKLKFIYPINNYDF